MRFLPENVLLKHHDFDGFTVGKNPLLAGAEALSNYWMKVSLHSGGKEPEPYVLLIVRPSGAKYYAARKLLEPLNRPFGYELVEENLPLEIPPADPVAAELCRKAVQEVLKERDDLQRMIASHGPEMLSRNPKYRVIRKPGGGFEVEYDPHAKLGGNGYGGGSDPRLKNPLGNEGFDSPPEKDAPDRSPRGPFYRPYGSGSGGSPLVSRLPQPGTGAYPGTGTPNPRTGKPGGSSDGNFGKANLYPNPNPDAKSNAFPEPFAASQGGRGTGLRNREPHLLPADILRRSRGQVPFSGDNASLTPSNPETPGTPGTQPGRPPAENKELGAGRFGSDPANPGEGNLKNFPYGSGDSSQPSQKQQNPLEEPALGHTGPVHNASDDPGGSRVASPEEILDGQTPKISEAPGNSEEAPNQPGQRQGVSGRPGQTQGVPGRPGQSRATSMDAGNISSNIRSGQVPQEMPLNSANGNSQGTPSQMPSFGSSSTSQPQSGSPGMAGQPPMPNFLNLNSRRSMKNRTTPYQRRWGLSDPRASIGFEREVTIRVEPNRLVVGDAFAVSFNAKTTKDQLSAGMLEAIERKVRTWGRPPTSFYWVPTIHFQTPPSGMPIYHHMNDTAKNWGLETTITETPILTERQRD